MGAFLSPLIAEPFLAQQEEHYSFSNTSQSDSLLNHTNILHNSSFIESLPSITYAYGIIGIFAFFVTVMFATLFCISVEEGDKTKVKTPKYTKTSNSLVSVIVILLASLLLTVYAGIEIGYGQMIATFAVKSDLHLSKVTASLITSVYWGTFTFSRGVSILLAAKLSPFCLILIDLCLMLVSSSILFFFGNNNIECLWVGTAVLGLALASFYPATITWVEKHINVSNKVASAFVIAASLGEMVVPLTVSQFVDTYPEMLFVIVFYSVIACGVLVFILLLILRKIGNTYTIEQPVLNHVEEIESPELNVSNFQGNESVQLNKQIDEDCA